MCHAHALLTRHGCACPGCTLPVEMFFPAAEFPTPELEGALGALGVQCRTLPLLSPGGALGMGEGPEAHLAGFKMKIAALLLSRFQEVCGWGQPDWLEWAV